MKPKMLSVPEALAQDHEISIQAIGVYVALLPLASPTGVVNVGLGGMADETGLSGKSLSKYLRELTAAGWCEIWRERVQVSRGVGRVMVMLYREKKESRR